MKIINLLEANDKSIKRDRVLEPTTPSKQAEVYYRKQLNSIINQLVEYIINKLKPNLNDAVEEHVTDYVDSFLQLLQEVSILDISKQAETIALRTITQINNQNKRQIARSYNNAFGINLDGIMSDYSIRTEIQKSLIENVDLITSIKNDFVNDLGEHVFTTFKKGSSYKDLANIIRERGNVTMSRAKFIARDQVSKINSDLQEARAKSLGNDLYYWRGSNDERERATHRALNNKLCKYSDPTVYSDDDGITWKKRKNINAFIGKCGEDYQCRCTASPYINLKEYGI